MAFFLLRQQYLNCCHWTSTCSIRGCVLCIRRRVESCCTCNFTPIYIGTFENKHLFSTLISKISTGAYYPESVVSVHHWSDSPEQVHGVENQEAMQSWVSTIKVCSVCVCLLGRAISVHMHVRVFCQWCVHARSCCSRGFVEACRDLLESVCEACRCLHC